MCVLIKKTPLESFIILFLTKNLVRLFLVKESKPFPDRKMIHLIRHSLAKTRCRMTTAITFSRQNLKLSTFNIDLFGVSSTVYKKKKSVAGVPNVKFNCKSYVSSPFDEIIDTSLTFSL